MLGAFSRTTTSTPRFLSSRAAASPPRPAPTTTPNTRARLSKPGSDEGSALGRDALVDQCATECGGVLRRGALTGETGDPGEHRVLTHRGVPQRGVRVVGVEDPAQGRVVLAQLVVEVADVRRRALRDDLATVQPAEQQPDPLAVELDEHVGLVGEVPVDVVELPP